MSTICTVAIAPSSRRSARPVVARMPFNAVAWWREAARSAGVFESGAVMGRPACAMLPQSIGSGAAAASIGCIGNRVYTALGDDEMYVAIPGVRWADFVERLIEVQRSNLTMGNYYQAQAAKFAAPK